MSFTEKLLNEKPRVPIKPPPPYPPCNSIVLEPVSTSEYSKSTVPVVGLIFLKSGVMS